MAKRTRRTTVAEYLAREIFGSVGQFAAEVKLDRATFYRGIRGDSVSDATREKLEAAFEMPLDRLRLPVLELISERLRALEPSKPLLLTAAEVAQRLRCTRAHVYGLMDRGQLPYVTIPGGGSRSLRRVDPAQFAAWLRSIASEVSDG